MYRLITLVCIVVSVTSLSLLANDKHSKSAMAHNANTHGASLPQQGGQAAFSALNEIVAMLEADPETDWSTINIDRLQAHLKDMDSLILDTEAATVVVENTLIQFNVRSTSALPAIHNMVPAHSQFIQQSRDWQIDTTLTSDGAQVNITTKNPDDLVFLQALGFYGFMSLDSHHQAHHIQMARGHSH